MATSHAKTRESFGAIVLQPKKKEKAASRGETTQKKRAIPYVYAQGILTLQKGPDK